MTKEDLYNIYVNTINNYLKSNSVYIKNWTGFDEPSFYRQLEILITVNLYLKIMKYYLDGFDTIVDLLDISEIIKVANESNKLLKLYKTYYE